jgi:hypothetical protein
LALRLEQMALELAQERKLAAAVARQLVRALVQQA